MNKTEGKSETIKRSLDECGAYLAASKPKKGIWLPVVGAITCVISFVSPGTITLISIGAFMVFWGVYLRPHFFSKQSADYVFYSIFYRFNTSPKNIERAVRFVTKFGDALDGKESPYQFLDGRFLKVHQSLSDFFLVKYSAKKLISRIDDNAQNAIITRSLNAVILINIVIAISEGEEELSWPEKYKQKIEDLIATCSTNELAIIPLLQNNYPELFLRSSNV